MSAISEETMEIFKYIGDLTSIHSTSYALRLLNDSTYMQQLLDQNNQSSSDLHELISYLINAIRNFDRSEKLDNEFKRLEKEMFTCFHACASKVEQLSADEDIDNSQKLASMEDGLRQFRQRKRNDFVRKEVIEAIISQNTDRLTRALETAGPKNRWNIAGRIVLENLIGDGVHGQDLSKFDKIQNALIEAKKKLGAATERAFMLEKENSSTHERLIELKRQFRELKSQNEVYSKTVKEKIIELSPRMRTSANAKLQMEAAQRHANMLTSENNELQGQVDVLTKELREVKADLNARAEELDATQNMHTQTTIRRLQRDLKEEKMERRKAEKQLAYALKEAKMHGKNSEHVQSAQANVDYKMAEAKTALKNAQKMKENAKQETIKAAEELSRNQSRVNELEHHLRLKDEEIHELKVILAEKEAEIRAEGSREVMKQQAEVERLKTMMEWKAKIVEDDVKFRTESGWRERTKLLISEIQQLRQLLETTMMEKGATEAALKDAGAKLAQRDHALAMSEQEVNHLNTQLQTMHHIKDSIHRLKRTTEEQWRQVANRDESTLRHLEAELMYFQQSSVMNNNSNGEMNNQNNFGNLSPMGNRNSNQRSPVGNRQQQRISNRKKSQQQNQRQYNNNQNNSKNSYATPTASKNNRTNNNGSGSYSQQHRAKRKHEIRR